MWGFASSIPITFKYVIELVKVHSILHDKTAIQRNWSVADPGFVKREGRESLSGGGTPTHFPPPPNFFPHHLHSGVEGPSAPARPTSGVKSPPPQKKKMAPKRGGRGRGQFGPPWIRHCWLVFLRRGRRQGVCLRVDEMPRWRTSRTSPEKGRSAWGGGGGVTGYRPNHRIIGTTGHPPPPPPLWCRLCFFMSLQLLQALTELSRPRVSSMRKNRTDQIWAPGIVARASG